MEVLKTAQFWVSFQNTIEEVCKLFDEQWQIRKRLINSKTLVFFILHLVMSKNKQGYNSSLLEIFDISKQKNINLFLKNRPVAASSICVARQKVSEDIFLELNKHVLNHQENDSLWYGHRVFAIDGCRVFLPRLLQEYGYKCCQKAYYPTGLMSCLYNLGNKKIYDINLNSHLNERLSAFDHLEKISRNDIVVMDRGYFSYLLLYKTLEKHGHLLCRLPSSRVNRDVQNFIDSDLVDDIMEYHPSGSVKSEIKKQGFDLNYKKIPLRLFKYKIEGTTYICATTLLDKKYTIEDLTKVYHGRWGIEELYKISKQFIEVNEFHSKTERGIKQEIYAHALLINIARIFEIEAENTLTSTKTKPPDKIKLSKTTIKDSYWQSFCMSKIDIKINFKHCLSVISRQIINIFYKTESIFEIMPNIISSIARVTQKIRKGRQYSRYSKKPNRGWNLKAKAKMKFEKQVKNNI